jgi:hypothetical protein
MSTIFYGSDWNTILEQIKDKEGEARTYGVDFYVNADGRFNNIIDLWKQAGYDKSGTVEWINYYPGKHFDQSVVEAFEKFTGYKCARAWISKIRPGKYAPYHWDIDDQEEEYLAQGELKRWSCTVSEPSKGQVFIVEDTVIHNEPQGTVIEWPNHRAWHAGGNCSFKPKYLFNFLGIKK